MHKIVLAAAAVLVAACALAPPSPLTLTSAQQLRLDQVVVTVSPDAHVSWGNAAHEFVVVQRNRGLAPQPTNQIAASVHDPQSKEADADQALAATPEGKAFIHAKVSNRLKEALERSIKSRLQGGHRSTRLEVTVKSFAIPSAVERVMIGGRPFIVASAELKDAVTGEVLAKREDLAATAIAGNGWGGVLADQLFDDLDVRVVNSYAERYHAWLLPEA